MTLKDANGFAFVAQMLEGAKRTAREALIIHGPILRQKVEKKSAYYEKVGDVVAVSGFTNNGQLSRLCF